MAVFSKSMSKIWLEKFKIPSPNSEDFFDCVFSERSLEDGSVVVDVKRVPVTERYKGITADMWSVDTLLKTGNRDALRPTARLASSPLSVMDSVNDNVDAASIVVPEKS